MPLFTSRIVIHRQNLRSKQVKAELGDYEAEETEGEPTVSKEVVAEN